MHRGAGILWPGVLFTQERSPAQSWQEAVSVPHNFSSRVRRARGRSLGLHQVLSQRIDSRHVRAWIFKRSHLWWAKGSRTCIAPWYPVCWLSFGEVWSYAIAVGLWVALSRATLIHHHRDRLNSLPDGSQVHLPFFTCHFPAPPAFSSSPSRSLHMLFHPPGRLFHPSSG